MPAIAKHGNTILHQYHPEPVGHAIDCPDGLCVSSCGIPAGRLHLALLRQFESAIWVFSGLEENPAADLLQSTVTFC